MGSPQDAAFRHRLNSIRAVIQSFEADLRTASPFGRPDIELLISFFKDAEKTAKSELELHELVHGGIEARERAFAHPERFITNAPAPPIDIFDRTPRRPRRSREERIASKRVELEADLEKAKARLSELQKLVSDWYLCAFPEWNAVTANARARWSASQQLAIEQYSALKFNSEHLPDLQDRGKFPGPQKTEAVRPAHITSSIQAWKLIERDYTLRLQIVAPEWATEHRRAWNAVFAEGRKRGNSAYYGPALVEMEIADADKRAEWCFQTCCEIWELQGRTKCSFFLQAIFEWCLQPMFSTREGCMRHELELHGQRTRTAVSLDLSAIGGHMIRQMAKLRAKWNTKLEIATRDNEYRGNKSPKPEPAGRIESTTKPKSSPKPAGRKPTRDPHFDRLARELWKRNQGPSGRVSTPALKRIATALDESPFCDPSDWLEGKAAEDLKKHNQKYGHSQKKIVSWTDVVLRNQPNFKEAMRRMLSRCAGKSGN